MNLCESCGKKIKSTNEFPLCRACNKKRKRLTHRIAACMYKNDQCNICGLKRITEEDMAMFDFHHVDPSDKGFELGDNIECRTWESIKNELDKCLMLCANCHRKIHVNPKQEHILKYAKIKVKEISHSF